MADPNDTSKPTRGRRNQPKPKVRMPAAAAASLDLSSTLPFSQPPQTLEEAMAADTYPDGRKVWTPAVAASLLVFFVIAMQCISTLAIGL